MGFVKNKKIALLALAVACMPGALLAAEPLTKQQGDEILQELKAIRVLLEKQAQNAPAAASQRATAAPKNVTLTSAEGHAALGAKAAPVTIVEFTDLQCPYCARFSAQTFPELRRKYIDTGKVRFVTRDLPLSFHAQSVQAAVAARCAGEQGKYWEYRERLFERQKELPQSPFDRLAADMKLDTAKFTSCRNSKEASAAAEADREFANGLGITGTPTFIVGPTTNGTFTGEKLSGAMPLTAFESRIDALLTAK